MATSERMTCVTDAPRSAVVEAGREVLQAAVAYVDGRDQDLPTLALTTLYVRLERAVSAFHAATDE